MKVFITGGSGWIGSAVVAELVAQGHSVTGLARSDEAADKLTSLGASIVRGSLEDLEVIRSAATSSDAVIHCAFVRGVPDLLHCVTVDKNAVEAVASVLEGSNKPFILTSAILILVTNPSKLLKEDDEPNWESPMLKGPFGVRAKTEQFVLGLKDKGIRSIVIRLPASVHGKGDKGFVPLILQNAQKNGFAGYPGDGENAWSCAHRLDVAKLYVLALEKAGPRSVLHGIGEEGVKMKDIMTVIGKGLGIDVKSDVALDTFAMAWMGVVVGIDCRASSVVTRRTMGWEPAHKGLLSDMLESYF